MNCCSHGRALLMVDSRGAWLTSWTSWTEVQNQCHASNPTCLLHYSLMHGSVIFLSGKSWELCTHSNNWQRNALEASPVSITIIRQWHTQLDIDMHGCYIGVWNTCGAYELPKAVKGHTSASSSWHSCLLACHHSLRLIDKTFLVLPHCQSCFSCHSKWLLASRGIMFT